MILDPNWREWHKIWSMRIALLWMVVSGLYIALPAFTGMINPVQFAMLSVGFSVAIGVARLTNQPGVTL